MKRSTGIALELAAFRENNLWVMNSLWMNLGYLNSSVVIFLPMLDMDASTTLALMPFLPSTIDK
jgi:hypothetical protein